MFKNGLYVGKFMAYHKGHQHCINSFSKLCEKLNVVICTRPDDRINSSIRVKWLEKDLINNLYNEIENPTKIKFSVLQDEKFKPYPDGIVEWCEEINRLCGKIDVMFGNEDYVKECSKIFKSEYYIPDVDRKRLNISSTKILDGNMKYYDLMNTVTKPHFNKIIRVLGSERVGKSYISSFLANEFDGTYIKEFGRDYIENEILKQGLHGQNHWSLKEFENCSLYHYNELQKLMDKPSKFIIIDMDPLTIDLYSNIYLRENSEVLKQLIEKYKCDLTILLSHNKNTVLNYEDCEYLRHIKISKLSEIDTDFSHKNFIHSLKHYNQKFIEVKCNNYEERENEIKNIMKKRFNL